MNKYKLTKKVRLWDKIPEEVSCEWLYEHGYAPF